MGAIVFGFHLWSNWVLISMINTWNLIHKNGFLRNVFYFIAKTDIFLNFEVKILPHRWMRILSCPTKINTQTTRPLKQFVYYVIKSKKRTI